MKLLVIFMLMATLSLSCTKRDRISDFEPAPNTAAEKDGSQAGTGSSSSLGSDHPSEPASPANP